MNRRRGRIRIRGTVHPHEYSLTEAGTILVARVTVLRMMSNQVVIYSMKVDVHILSTHVWGGGTAAARPGRGAY